MITNTTTMNINLNIDNPDIIDRLCAFHNKYKDADINQIIKRLIEVGLNFYENSDYKCKLLNETKDKTISIEEFKSWLTDTDVIRFELETLIEHDTLLIKKVQIETISEGNKETKHLIITLT